MSYGENGRNVNYLVGVFDEGGFTDNDTEEEDYKEVPFKNKALAITTKEDIPRIVDQLIWDIEKRVDVYVEEGSGWYFTCAYEINIEMPVYEPLRASSHLPLPEGMPKRNNGIINIQNEDDRCFEWCILAELYPVRDHRYRPSQYREHLGALNFDGIEFPVKADKDTMEKFEKQNPGISVSIYGWSEKKLLPIRIAPRTCFI